MELKVTLKTSTGEEAQPLQLVGHVRGISFPDLCCSASSAGLHKLFEI